MKRRTTWAAMAAATLLLLSACGNGSDDGATDDGAAENGAAEDTAGDDGGERPDSLVLGLVPSQDVDELVEDADILGELIGAELGVEVETFKIGRASCRERVE